METLSILIELIAKYYFKMKKNYSSGKCNLAYNIYYKGSMLYRLQKTCTMKENSF